MTIELRVHRKMNSLASLRLARSLTRPTLRLHSPAFTTRPRMASTNAFQFAEGEDTQQLTRDAETLLQQGWARDVDGMGVTKTFHFKSYFKAVVSSVGDCLSCAPATPGSS